MEHLQELPPDFAWGVATAAYQIEGSRPSSATAPSTWYAEVAAPHRKPGGSALVSVIALLT